MAETNGNKLDKIITTLGKMQLDNELREKPTRQDTAYEARALAQHIEDNHKIDALQMENAEMREIIEKFLLLNPRRTFELWDTTRFNARALLDGYNLKGGGK